MPVLILSLTPSEMVVSKQLLLPKKLRGEAFMKTMAGETLSGFPGPPLAFLLVYSHNEFTCVLF